MKKNKDSETTIEGLQKRESLVTRTIIMISIFIGMLITFLLTGILDFLTK